MSFMRLRIILGPMPAKFILESPSPSELLGSIMLNIFAITSFSTLGAFGFLMAVSPQKVKNMVTFLPNAAAPLAITKAARMRSRSLLKTTKVLSSFAAPLLSGRVPAPFWMVAVILLALVSRFSSLFPVTLHQEGASVAKPGSVAVILSISPSLSLSISSLSFTMGPGHCKPQASASMVTPPVGMGVLSLGVLSSLFMGWSPNISSLLCFRFTVL